MKKAITKYVAVMSTALMLMGCCKIENTACYETGVSEIPEQIPRCSTKPQFWNDSCDDLVGS